MSDDTRSTQRMSSAQMRELQNIVENGAELTMTVTPSVLARIGELLPVIEEIEGLDEGSLSVDAGAMHIMLVGLDVLEG